MISIWAQHCVLKKAKAAFSAHPTLPEREREREREKATAHHPSPPWTGTLWGRLPPLKAMAKSGNRGLKSKALLSGPSSAS